MKNSAEFLAAVKSGDIDSVQALLAVDPALLDAQDENGLTAVLAAAYWRQPAIAALLVGRGAALSIHDAAAVGAADRVRSLLDSDPSLANARALDGHYPLGLACFFGHTELAGMFLEGGADVEAVADNAMRIRAVHAAAACSDQGAALRTMRLLIEHGADVNTAQHGGWTPIHQAAQAGSIELVTLLIEHGADVNARADDGGTPLEKAMEKGHEEAAELLRTHGAVETT